MDSEEKNKIDKIAEKVESFPLIQKEKIKFSWLDRIVRWGNRAFLAIWIFKRKGL